MTARIRLLVFLALTAAFSTGAGALPEDMPDRGQRVYEYEILRDGEPVGSHLVLIEPHEGGSRVVSQSLIEIGVLGITFYRFRYQSEEEWDAKGLRRLRVQVEDDGEPLAIDGRRRGDRFHLSLNGQDPSIHDMPLYPTNHWNPTILSQSRVLNTLTGRLNRVSIRPNHQATPELDGAIGEVNAYRYSGDLHLDSWYDATGRWIGMRFEARDGSLIEYHCRNCWASRSL